MFLVFDEDTSTQVGEYRTLEDAIDIASQKPDSLYIYDDRHMVGYFTEDGGETWEKYLEGAVI